MANREISQLTEKSTPVGTDEIEIQETGGGSSKRATLTNVFEALGTRVYDAAETYDEDDLVVANGILYISLTDNNTGNTPASSDAEWRASYRAEQLGAANTSLSGASVVLTTNVPDWVKRVTLTLIAVSPSAAADIELFVGGASGYSSVYFGGFAQLATGGVTITEESSSHVLYNAASASNTLYGKVDMVKEVNDEQWVITSIIWDEQGDELAVSTSVTDITGGAVLDRVKIEPSTGNFDAGAVSIFWE